MLPPVVAVVVAVMAVMAVMAVGWAVDLGLFYRKRKAVDKRIEGGHGTRENVPLGRE